MRSRRHWRARALAAEHRVAQLASSELQITVDTQMLVQCSIEQLEMISRWVLEPDGSADFGGLHVRLVRYLA